MHSIHKLVESQHIFDLNIQEQQQYFFMAFIVAIVATMKYIDIEFANQPVVLPLYHASGGEEDTIEELDVTSVAREQAVSNLFQGCLIPPSNVWQAASDKDANKRPSKTKTLKKFIITTKPKITKKDKGLKMHSKLRMDTMILEDDSVDNKSKNSLPVSATLYMQEKGDYGHFHFTKVCTLFSLLYIHSFREY